ncbi:MAG: cytochrome c [Gallionellaceae bacterium]|nr:cytochrome c [Gallionellaceae bacterium]
MKSKSPLILAFAVLCCAPAVHAASFMGNAERGKMIFSQRCAMCHGEDAKGRDGMAPDLIAEWHRLTKSEDELARNIRTGQQTPGGKIYTGGPPPPLTLSDRDMDDVLAYMKSAFGSGAPQFNNPQPDKPPFGAPPFGAPQPKFGR